MKILKLTLKNFRGFEEKTLEFTEGFNLLVGDNGSGKTAVLDALAIGISSMFMRLHGEDYKEPESDDIGRAVVRHGEIPTLEILGPLDLSFEGLVFSWSPHSYADYCPPAKLIWSLAEKRAEGTKGRVFQTIDRSGLLKYADALQAMIDKGAEAYLPLFRYFGTGRLWKQGQANGAFEDSPSSRSDGYTSCLNPRSDEARMVAWFKKMEFMSLRRSEPIGVLEGVRQAITACIDGCENVEVDPDVEGIQARFKDDRILPFRMLSDGYRNMLAMVADIAYRAAVLNPHLGKEAPRKTAGIVLIDEIDLHLHPRWQQSVVPSLRRAFPQVQFIATSHSPFIIQSLKPGELINLDEGPTGEYASQPISDIIEYVQGLEATRLRGSRWHNMYETAKEYYALLDKGKDAPPEEKERLKKKLDEMAAPFSDDPAYVAFLEMERLAAGLGGKGNANK